MTSKFNFECVIQYNKDLCLWLENRQQTSLHEIWENVAFMFVPKMKASLLGQKCNKQ